jgi:hypothetical protein
VVDNDCKYFYFMFSLAFFLTIFFQLFQISASQILAKIMGSAKMKEMTLLFAMVAIQVGLDKIAQRT